MESHLPVDFLVYKFDNIFVQNGIKWINPSLPLSK